MERERMFEDIIKEYLADCVRRGIKERSVTTYTSILRRVDAIADEEGIHALGQELADAVRRRMESEGLKSTRLYLVVLDQLSLYATGRKAVEERMLLTPHEVRRERITIYDYARIRDAADPPHRMAMALCVGMGLRISEAAAIRWCDITGRWAHIYGKGHGQGKEATIYVPDLVVRALEEWRACLGDVDIDVNAPIVGYVRGNAVIPYSSGGQLAEGFRLLSRSLGIPFTTHSFRRLYAQLIYEHDPDIYRLSKLMRHTSIDTTQIYLTVAREDLASTVAGAMGRLG